MAEQYEDELARMKARKDRQRLERIRREERERLRREGYAEEDDYVAERPKKRQSRGQQYTKNQQPQRRKKKKNRFGRFLLILFIVLAAVAGIYVFLQKKHESGYWNIAVFGVDSRDGNLGKGALADVDMICSINREAGEIRLVSVFRDTYLKIDSKGTYHKLNEAYFKGGQKQAVSALEQNLDIHIDDYATFNWKAVVDAINILGGVDIDITDKEFKYINSFITETVNSTGVGSVQLKKAGMNHLDGVQAVAYSRLRLMDTDFNRTERQRKVVSLAFDKAKAADFSVLNNILVTVLPQVSTSIGVTDLIPMAKDTSKYHLGESGGFPFSRGTTMIGKMDCVIPTTLESNVVQLHEFLYGETGYVASAEVKKISAKIAKDSGMGDVGENAPASSGSGSSGSGSSGSKKETTAAAVEETTAVEQTTEAVEETTAEVTEAETEKETVKETKEEIVGPGANIPETSSSASSEKPTVHTEENSGPGAEQPTKGTVQPSAPADSPVETKAPAADSEVAGPGAGPGQ